MIELSTIKFLKNLSENNNRNWFLENKKEYEAAKNNVIEIAKGIIQSLGKIDADISLLEPSKCLFRINRDVRFSKDKSPYKTNFGASFEKGGRISPYAAYYLHIEPGNKSFAAGGLWHPPSSQINAVRQEIDYNFSDFKKIINEPSFKNHFKGINMDPEIMLVREPGGYNKSNPAIEYLKLKSWTAARPFTDEEICSEGFLLHVISSFKAIAPFIQFLNAAVSETI